MTMTHQHPVLTELTERQIHHWAELVDAYPPTNWSSVRSALAQLRDGKYRVVRLTNSWLITDNDPDTDTEPTIVADTVAEAVAKILHPDPRLGKTRLGPPPTD